MGSESISLLGSVLGRSVLRNTTITLAATLLPLVVALVSVPIVIRGFGLERYGILAVALVVLGYSGVFDLGLGRATTKFVSLALAKGDERAAAQVFWTSFSMNLLVGLVGAVTVTLLAPLLVDHVLRIPPALHDEAGFAFYGIAALVPVTTATSALIGLLEARHRFDLVSLLQAPSLILSQLVPLAVLPFTTNLGVVLVGLVLVRACLLVAAGLACLRIWPSLTKLGRFDGRRLRRLLGFGGWLTVTNAIGPIMVNADRFVIGTLVSMSAVAYYATPYDMVTRLLIVPTSLFRTLFPIFGGLQEVSTAGVKRLLTDASKYLGLVMGMVVVPIVALSAQLLGAWVGEEFATRSSTVLQVLALGVWMNGLAFVPYAFVQGVGRPDITAKLHIFELLLYIPLLWFLMRLCGITGVALAWLVRVMIDTAALFIVARKLLGPVESAAQERRGRATVVVLLAALVLGVCIHAAPGTPVIKLILGSLLVIAMICCSWFFALTSGERRDVQLAVAAVLRPSAGR